MARAIRAAHAAFVVAGALTMLGAASVAEGQRALPRIGVAAPPRPPERTGQAAQPPGANGRNDPRWNERNDPRWSERNDPRWNDGYDPRARDGSRADGHRARRSPYDNGTTIVYVPVPGEYGYGYSQGAYYPQRSYGGVYDANGRPLSTSLESVASSSAYGYTPDLSGSPYAVTTEGMMVVDFDGADRRAFPSCAGQEATRDPNGRPRTVFYQPSDYWMVLRPGQRGRVQGTPPAGAAACYAIDSVGRVVLRY